MAVGAVGAPSRSRDVTASPPSSDLAPFVSVDAMRASGYRGLMTKVLPSTVGAWHPFSWRDRTGGVLGEVDAASLARAVGRLAKLPPLVTSWEIETLKSQLAEAATGDRFLLQGGDCAESFDACASGSITNKLKVLLQAGLVLEYGAKRPVIRVGRMAGQYAKPRSEPTETRDGVTLPSYYGDLVNGPEFTLAARTPNPKRMLRGYERAALTLNFIRALVDGGFADVHHPEYWDLGFVEHSPYAAAYRRVVHQIAESLDFAESLAGRPLGELRRVDFFTSHEALLLPYEAAQTRQVPRRTGWYNLATHFPWLGLRTTNLDGAHVEYLRGIANPIAVKIGPKTSAQQVVALLEVLHPHNEPGRLTLICRMGASHVGSALPPLIEAVTKTGKPVLWCADPMHGNTVKLPSGHKTRRFADILAELEEAMAIHAKMGTHLGGVHLELTGDDVIECSGGARGVPDTELEKHAPPLVDPRLNRDQALEIALRITEVLGAQATPRIRTGRPAGASQELL